ncbi:MAG: histidine kinase [Uliginosibacterium sp.]|nr:histidine kinase [Uliginosibacterium sp.]
MLEKRFAAAGQRPLPAPATRQRLLWLWLAFCVVKLSGAVLLHRLYNGGDVWQPALWESTSLVVASGIMALHYRVVRRSGELVGQPWRWLLANLIPLPLWCLLFTPLTYGLRHALYEAIGRSYHHAGWSGVLIYESLQLSLFFLLWLAVVYALASQERIRQEQTQRREVLNALREAHLTLLRQQLQPHFLFNALNLISATMYEDVPKADALLRHLAKLLRQAIASSHQANHSLQEEVCLLRAYAEIMGARFEGRVTVDWQVDAALDDCRLPAMITQPLLENAFKYGVEPFSTPSRLQVQIDAPVAGHLRVRIVQNRGRHAPGAEPGHGLANIRQRLAAHYDDRASLTLDNLEPEGVCATLSLPCAY